MPHLLKNKPFKILLIASFLCLRTSMFSQGPPPPPPPPPTTTNNAGPSCWPPPCVPIDNGILVLAFAAFAYGANKLYRTHKAKA